MHPEGIGNPNIPAQTTSAPKMCELRKILEHGDNQPKNTPRPHGKESTLSHSLWIKNHSESNIERENKQNAKRNTDINDFCSAAVFLQVYEPSPCPLLFDRECFHEN